MDGPGSIHHDTGMVSATHKPTANLVLRLRKPSDDAFLFRLSERVFAPFSARPASAMAAMVTEPGALTILAQHDLVSVGFFVLGFERFPRSYGPFDRPVLSRLNALGVVPDAQGRGVGRVLLESAEQIARAEGAISMMLMTAEINYRARTLFESAGFVHLFVQAGAYAGGRRARVMCKVL